MNTEIVVRLSSNGRYWQADWKDNTGRRNKRSLGAKKDVSSRQARMMCRQIGTELAFGIRSKVTGEIPSLESLIDTYIASRTDLKPGTIYLHRLTKKYLEQFFGEKVKVSEISRVRARDWVTALSTGKLTAEKTPAAPTVRGHVVNAKAMFQRAVDDELLSSNPFAKIVISLPKIEKDWHYVSSSELLALFAACSTEGWKLLIALCRLAGLRRGEALALCWKHVDLVAAKMTVFASKTEGRRSGKRVVPIDPQLLQLLLSARKSNPGPDGLVCHVSAHSLWRDFRVIRRRAGLPLWADGFQVMRRNCETDWAQRFPQYVVSEWLGHDIRISAEHYLSVPEELYLKASTH